MSRKLAETWFEAFRNKDISTLPLAEDFVHTSPFGAIKGRQTYLDLVNENPKAFFSATIKLIDFIESSDKVAVRYLVDDMPACDCIYVRNDQISEIFSYYHYGDLPTF